MKKLIGFLSINKEWLTLKFTMIRNYPIKKAKITPLSMGYLVCAPGGRVGQVGQVDLIKPSDTERVSSYAITAEFYGFKMLYLEAGSGAAKPVSPQLIETARESCDLTIIVGGGIRDGAAAKTAVRAGADWIITGNLTESYNDADELQNVLSHFIEEMNSWKSIFFQFFY